MHWYYYLAYFFGGAFLANTLPHIGNGISGRPFQSPFAKPPGKGLSSSRVNVLWGFFNLFVEHRQNWGEDRVHLHDENGQLFSLPAGWTDVAAADPFVVIAAGRCPFTTDGLLALADLVRADNLVHVMRPADIR